MSNVNNGLITKIWGPHQWIAFHCIIAGYPINPTDEQKKTYKEYFINLGKVLPCRYCRDSYAQFIQSGDSKLNDYCMKNRYTLKKWGFNLHNAVNNKLGIDYGVTFDDYNSKYEAFRAKCTKNKTKTKVKGCVVPLNDKAYSYKMAKCKDCPVIDHNIAKKFIHYAKIRKINPREFYILKKIKNDNKLKYYLTNKTCDFWTKRNEECANIISNMRINGINSLENFGQWKDLPTIDELKLILRLSSNLPEESLHTIIKKLPKKRKKIYIIKSLD